jgi:hypothetical protein
MRRRRSPRFFPVSTFRFLYFKMRLIKRLPPDAISAEDYSSSRPGARRSSVDVAQASALPEDRLDPSRFLR